MDKELLIDCLYNKDVIKYHLSSTRKAQNDILTKKPSPQFYHAQSSKYGVRQPVQIKNPLLIKSLFSSRKYSKEKDISLPICAFKILPTQTLASFQTDRIHSKCPAFKKLKLKLGLKQQNNVPDEQLRVETAPAICRSQTSAKQTITNILKSQPSIEKDKKSEPTFTFNRNDWGLVDGIQLKIIMMLRCLWIDGKFSQTARNIFTFLIYLSIKLFILFLFALNFN